jgi:1-acyl-sn-glycerol-3-phosphate acyltransferase
MRLSGWRIVGALPALPKFIIVVAPHTSNWDFVVGVMAMFALDLRIHWFGKDTLFRPPLGALFLRLGGRPINRGTHEGVVAEMASIVRAEPKFLLAVTPEGTRKRVTQWRTGFYRIAEAAGVPIVAVWFDWSRKEIGIAPPFAPTGDLPGDLERIQARYRPEMARHPENFWGERPE